MNQSGYDMSGFQVAAKESDNIGEVLLRQTYKLSFGPKILVGIAEVKLHPYWSL